MKNYLKIFKEYYLILGFSGIISLIKSKLFQKYLMYELKRKDLRAPLHLRIRSTDIYVYEEVFLKEEYNIKSFALKPKVIIDAGGNIGLTAVYFANRFPDVKILTIEPEKSNFDLLKLNTSYYSQIIPIRAALWSENKKIRIKDSGKGSWAYQTSDNSDLQSTTLDDDAWVDGFTLDYIMYQYNLVNIDILKIDIEGSEKEIFETSSSWINQVNCIIVELHEHLKPGCLRSFYNGSNGFDLEWNNEDVYFLLKQDKVQFHQK